MNALVVLFILMGGFLIMDSICEQKIRSMRKSSRTKIKYKPLSLIDEQLSGKSLRRQFHDMFDSAGPWMYRDDVNVHKDLLVDDDDRITDDLLANEKEGRQDLIDRVFEQREEFLSEYPGEVDGTEGEIVAVPAKYTVSKPEKVSFSKHERQRREALDS